MTISVGMLQSCSSGDKEGENISDVTPAEDPVAQTDLVPDADAPPVDAASADSAPKDTAQASEVPTEPTPDIPAVPLADDSQKASHSLASTDSTPPKKKNKKRKSNPPPVEKTETPPDLMAETQIAPVPVLEAAPPPQPAPPTQMSAPQAQVPVVTPPPLQPAPRAPEPPRVSAPKKTETELPFYQEKMFLLASGLAIMAGIAFMMRKPA